MAALLDSFLNFKRRRDCVRAISFVTIREAGLDGFWIDRVLKANGFESYVVDPASIATSRRRRRAKTDRLDGEALVRALLALKRGEPRVCAMVNAPSPEEEDRCRVCRERKVLCGFRKSRTRVPLYSSFTNAGTVWRCQSLGALSGSYMIDFAVLSAGQEGRGFLLSHAVALEHCGGRCERSCREWRRPLMFGSAIRSCHLATGTWAVIRVVCADSVPQRFRTDGSAAGQ